MASVDIERGPVREDLYRTLARIDLERDVIGHDDRIAWLNSWIGIVRAAGWQHAGRQDMAVRLSPVDTAGGEHDGSDADAHPVFPGGAQQKTRGRSRQLEPAKYV